MTKQEFLAVNFKFEQDKNEILKEISELQNRRQINVVKIQKEEKKLQFVDEMFEKFKTVKAGMLHHGYNPENVKKAEKEIKKIDEFIETQNRELQKVVEKQKEVERIYNEKIKEIDRQRRKKEEDNLFEMKQINR